MATLTKAVRRRLGKTGMEVFPLNLGGNVFGWTADREASFAVLDAYFEADGNFIDTADAYNKWVAGHVGGESEALIGEWMRLRGVREEMVIATKVGSGGAGVEPGLSADKVRRGAEGSLNRLGVEQIDLYYAHRDDPNTPLEETLGAFDALVREGKVRAIGASNYSASRLQEALDISKKNGFASYAVLQPEYNLVSRETLEGELADVAMRNGLAVATYYSLAAGFLTGKYRKGEKSDRPRASAVQEYLDDPTAVARLQALGQVAEKHGTKPAQIAIAWLLHKPFVTTPIASATNPAQVQDLVAAVEIELDADDMRKLDG
jgi:aryl-alcohol dehydrogenase-like predicted oxidoreductase